MKQNQTLRKRIVFFFCTYLFVLILLFTEAINLIIHFSQDRAFKNQILDTSEQILLSLQETGELPALPHSFEAYRGLSQVPDKLKPFVQDRKNGHFEINHEELDLHVNICSIPALGEKIFVFYNIGPYEVSEDFEFSFNLGLLGIGLLIMFLGWFLSRMIANQIMTPITALVQSIDSISPEKEFQKLSDYNANDEIGLLVKTINDLIKRTENFVQREREFTQFVSHELRTPISVIKGAVEILELAIDQEDKKFSSPMKRIDISIKELDVLIHTFLMLARQERIQAPVEGSCEIKKEVKKAVESYRYLLSNKDVEVELDLDQAGQLLVSPAVVNIAIGNLIRNAFQYTMKGKVEVICEGQHLIVRDTGLGLSESKALSGSGLGLLIVQRICERMKWHQTLKSLPEGGSQAELFFYS